MNKTLILVIAVGLLPAYASAAKLDLKQDLGGLDLAVAIEPPPPGDPVAIMITNKSTQLVACTLSYGGVEAGMASAEVTVQPGKSGTVRVTPNASAAPRSGNLTCAEKKATPKK